MEQEIVTTMIDSPTYGHFIFDAVFSTNHSANLTLTTHPVQSGASVADHAYMEPDEVTIEIGMTDTALGVETNHSVNAFAQLRQLMEAREPLTLVTRLKTYQNMVITSISAPDDYTTMHSLRASIYLTQVKIVDVSVVRVQEVTTSSKSGTSSGGSSGSSGSSSSGSTKPASPSTSTKPSTKPNQSVLSQLLDKLNGK